MANYRQLTGAGTTWIRAYRVTCNNSPDRRTIWFDEERVMIGPDGSRMSATQMGMGCGAELTAENAGEVIPLLDDAGEPTGQTMTYADVYRCLMSLYYHVAVLRDEQEIVNA